MNFIEMDGEQVEDLYNELCDKLCDNPSLGELLLENGIDIDNSNLGLVELVEDIYNIIGELK